MIRDYHFSGSAQVTFFVNVLGGLPLTGKAAWMYQLLKTETHLGNRSGPTGLFQGAGKLFDRLEEDLQEGEQEHEGNTKSVEPPKL